MDGQQQCYGEQASERDCYPDGRYLLLLMLVVVVSAVAGDGEEGLPVEVWRQGKPPFPPFLSSSPHQLEGTP